MAVKDVGTYIRVLMEGRDLTALMVTQAAGVHPNYVWRLEQGKIKRPALEIIVKLVRVVGGSLDDIGALMSSTQDAHQRAVDALALVRNEPEFDSAYQKLKATPEGRRALVETAQRVLQS